MNHSTTITHKKGKTPLSLRHKKAIKRAYQVIRESAIAPYVEKLYVYGSCARQEATWESDVDLFLVISSNIGDSIQTRDELLRLKSQVTSCILDEPEVDLKFVIGNDWENNNQLYYQNIRKEGIQLWH